MVCYFRPRHWKTQFNTFCFDGAIFLRELIQKCYDLLARVEPGEHGSVPPQLVNSLRLRPRHVVSGGPISTDDFEETLRGKSDD